jgi:hypothetical protein
MFKKSTHKPITRKVYVDTHSIWNRDKSVSKELEQRVVNIILRGGKQWIKQVFT